MQKDLSISIGSLQDIDTNMAGKAVKVVDMPTLGT